MTYFINIIFLIYKISIHLSVCEYIRISDLVYRWIITYAAGSARFMYFDVFMEKFKYRAANVSDPR